jgi:hypothetical protein
MVIWLNVLYFMVIKVHTECVITVSVDLKPVAFCRPGKYGALTEAQINTLLNLQ